MKRRCLLTLAAFAPAALARAQDGVRVRPEDPLEETAPQVTRPPQGFVELHRLRLANRKGGAIEISCDGGASWRTLGRVLRPATSTAEGHIAAEYATPGTVAAVAVHGIRLRISADDSMLHAPRLLSIVPREFSGEFRYPGYGGIVASASGIGTDIPAGASLFRGLAPVTGNPIFYEAPGGGRLIPLPPTYLPVGKGEIFVLPVWVPERRLSEVIFENRVGGKVTVRYENDPPELLCHVLKPVLGIGRFDGTAYTGVGRLNTSHTGVVTVSTAPVDAREPEGMGRERRGGFQISPAWHNSRCAEAGAPMVMTLGLLDEKGRPNHRARSQEGAAPLFRDQIVLSGSGASCDCKIDDGPWEALPALVGNRPNALTAAGLNAHWASLGSSRVCTKGLTALRVRLPKLTVETSKQMAATAISHYKQMRLAAARAGEAQIVSGILSINATPPNAESVAIVRLLVDGRPRGFTNVQPFVLSWDTTRGPDGEYLVEAEALDESGGLITSSTRRVYVLNEKT